MFCAFVSVSKKRKNNKKKRSRESQDERENNKSGKKIFLSNSYQRRGRITETRICRRSEAIGMTTKCPREAR